MTVSINTVRTADLTTVVRSKTALRTFCKKNQVDKDTLRCTQMNDKRWDVTQSTWLFHSRMFFLNHTLRHFFVYFLILHVLLLYIQTCHTSQVIKVSEVCLKVNTLPSLHSSPQYPASQPNGQCPSVLLQVEFRHSPQACSQSR